MPNYCYTNLAEKEKKKAHRSTYIKNARVLLTGTPCSISTLGFIIVTSWCRRSGWDSNSSGANSFITSSSCSAAWEGTPYHVFGSPLPKHKHRKEHKWEGTDGANQLQSTHHSQQHCPHKPLHSYIKNVFNQQASSPGCTILIWKFSYTPTQFSTYLTVDFPWLA